LRRVHRQTIFSAEQQTITEGKGMQTSNRLFDDLAKVASGAATALTGVREELDGMIRARMERYLTDLAVVTRDEFEAVKETAANARAAQEQLEKRVAELEAKLAAKPKRAPRAAKPGASDTARS
jgi:BMFP domain-containing protein YqiC